MVLATGRTASRRVQRGLMVLATGRLPSLRALWAERGGRCQPVPDVLVLGLGTAVEYRARPAVHGSGYAAAGSSPSPSSSPRSPSAASGRSPSPLPKAAERGSESEEGEESWAVEEPEVGGPEDMPWRAAVKGEYDGDVMSYRAWRPDTEWAALLDRSYDAPAVRNAVQHVVRQCVGLRVPPSAGGGGGGGGGDGGGRRDRLSGGGGAAAAAGGPLKGEGQGVPAVCFAPDEPPSRHLHCLRVHRSLVPLVERMVTERLTAEAEAAGGEAAAAARAGVTEVAAAAAVMPLQDSGDVAEGVSAGPSAAAAAPVTDRRHPPGSGPARAVRGGGGVAADRDPLTAATVSQHGIRFVVRTHGSPAGGGTADWVHLYILPAAVGKAAAVRHVLRRLGTDPPGHRPAWAPTRLGTDVATAAGDSDSDGDAELLAEAAAAVVTSPSLEPLQPLQPLQQQPSSSLQAEALQQQQQQPTSPLRLPSCHPEVQGGSSRSGVDERQAASAEPGVTAPGGDGGGRGGGRGGGGGRRPMVVVRPAARSGPAGLLQGLRLLGLV